MAFICCSSIAQATAYIRICLSTLRTILSIGQMAARHETNIPYSIQLIYCCTNFYQSNICIYTLHIQQIHTQCTYEAHNLVSVAWMEWQRKYTAFRFICFRPLFLSLSLFSDNIWFCAILCHCNVVCVHLSILLLLLLWKSFGIDIPTTRVWLMVADEWLFSLYLFCVNKRWVDEWMRGRQWLRVQIAWNEGCRDVSSVSDVNRVALVMY